MSVDCNKTGQEIFKACCPARIKCKVHQPKPRYKYIQPPPPVPCKPQSNYAAPEHPLESETIYYKSYVPFGVDTARQCRQLPFLTRPNIALSSAPFESRTVTGLSYPGTWQPPPEPIKPASKVMTGAGPMQSVTTQRHDYTPKPGDRPIPILPRGNIYLTNAKMEDSTVTMCSYLPLDRQEPPRSFKPQIKYEAPDQPFHNQTVQQSSYLRNELPPRESYPWMRKPCYQQPLFRMDGTTVYNGSYMPPGIFVEENSYSDRPNEICICCCNTATEDL